MNSFLVSIHSRLSSYENLKDSPALLVFAIWKSKITEQFVSSNLLLTTQMKMQCRTDSVTMVNIIVSNVMSFLTDGDDSHCVFDVLRDEDDDDDDDDNKRYASYLEDYLAEYFDEYYTDDDRDDEIHENDECGSLSRYYLLFRIVLNLSPEVLTTILQVPSYVHIIVDVCNWHSYVKQHQLLSPKGKTR